jgi:hypothetical protein
MLTKRVVVLLSATVTLAVGTAFSQDSPSLGDLARQQREQKEQAKAAADKNGKPVKVITNEQIPERPAAALHQVREEKESESTGFNTSADKLPAENWKSQILMQKNQIANLQREIDDLNESIRFAPANCVSNCVGWNERQREKQLRVERMQAQLEDQKRRLDEMQDSARRQGYGSSVYDP